MAYEATALTSELLRQDYYSEILTGKLDSEPKENQRESMSKIIWDTRWKSVISVQFLQNIRSEIGCILQLTLL